MEILRLLTAAVASLALSSCATVYSLAKPEQKTPDGPPITESWVYSGVKTDGLLLFGAIYCAGYDGHGCSRGSSWLWLASPFILIDTPLSLVADTLALPYTLHKQKSVKSEKQQ